MCPSSSSIHLFHPSISSCSVLSSPSSTYSSSSSCSSFSSWSIFLESSTSPPFMFPPLPLTPVLTSPPQSPPPSILLHPPFLLNQSFLLIGLPYFPSSLSFCILSHPAPPATSPDCFLHFLAMSLSFKIGLFTGNQTPLAAWNPEGAACSEFGARGISHLNHRHLCSRQLPQSSVLDKSVVGEDAAQAHLYDTHCWMRAYPLKMVTRRVW